MNVYQFNAVLGKRVRDKVTGLSGVVTSVTFDLYGCVQCIVNPGLLLDGKQADMAWFDHHRLEVTDPQPVMTPALWMLSSVPPPPSPQSEPRGPAEKPTPR